jgi:hypothetical protein
MVPCTKCYYIIHKASPLFVWRLLENSWLQSDWITTWYVELKFKWNETGANRGTKGEQLLDIWRDSDALNYNLLLTNGHKQFHLSHMTGANRGTKGEKLSDIRRASDALNYKLFLTNGHKQFHLSHMTGANRGTKGEQMLDIWRASDALNYKLLLTNGHKQFHLSHMTGANIRPCFRSPSLWSRYRFSQDLTP